jgi:hypothetical protein
VVEKPGAHALLAKALSSLTQEEQALVLGTLLPVQGLPGGSTDWLRDATFAQAAFAMQLAAERPGVRADKVALLVRLPASTHAALKGYADTTGHSMNVIVRSLVERFLDAQRAAG